jgi:TolB-like protein/predicted Ser/Thr protein kinase
MTNSGTADQVQAALAAFEEGKQTLEELEAALGAALHSGQWNRALVMEVLRDAVAAGRVPPDTLSRLGLGETGDATIARAADKPSESVDSTAAAPVPRESISTGQLLAGRYRLERKLGEGGMGVVYLASDQEVEGEIFAIKVLTPEIRERPDALELLREEVRKTRTLAHSNIVGVYSLNVYRTGVFILMEYLEGKTLQALLDEDFGRGMRFDRAWPIIEDLGAALAYAHDHSVIHGDLKPANVFVTYSGRAKLLDFGIARAARGSRWGKDAAALGALTPAYASCEMLEYLPPDTRDDIYALACIIYEMLSGRHPFDRHNAVEARDAGEKPLPITALTDRQNAALAQGLAFDRAARTATVEMLLAGLAPGAEPGKRRAVFSRATGVAALIVIVAAALLYFVADRFWLAKHRPSELPTTAATNIVSDKSIAVLPFADMSEKKDQEYFADGIAEEVLDRLAKVPGLKVVGRASSFQFKDKSTDPAGIGAALGVSYLLEGSVRRDAGRIRVAAQLVEARTGSQIWSDRFESDVIDVLNVQDTIAAEITRALQIAVEVDTTPRASVKSPEVLDAYLRGLQSYDRFTQEGIEAAVANFQQALTLDPAFAPAAIGVAKAYVWIGEEAWSPPRVVFERAREAALLAQQLDPKSASAHLSMAEVHEVYDWDWAGADRELQQAFALGPRGAYGSQVASELAASRGQWDEALQLAIEAVALDPLDAEPQESIGYQVYMRSGRLAEAEESFRRALQISPKYGSGHYYLGEVLMLQGNYEAALAEFRKENHDDGQLEGSAMAHFAAGRKSESDAALTEAISRNGTSWPSEIARVYAYRGEKDRAFEWLDRAYEMRDEDLYMIKGDPLLKNLESDPRYKAFLRKMNLPE